MDPPPTRGSSEYASYRSRIAARAYRGEVFHDPEVAAVVVEAAQQWLDLLSRQRHSVRWQIPLGIAVLGVQCLWLPWTWVWFVWAVGAALAIVAVVLIERKYPERERCWRRAREAHAELAAASHRGD